jgi:UDP-3-O-[3-hydroxymyristoyl] glucosamine N-acyltransferase
VMLHDVGEELEHVYFPHAGMASLVAVMQSGATVETATIGRSGVIGASAGLGARSTIGLRYRTRGHVRRSSRHVAAENPPAVKREAER